MQNPRDISERISAGGVAAAIQSASGRIYTGVCVDTSSSLGICAERNAIFAAITAGYTKGDFSEVDVMISSGEIGTPCLVCRQMISELFDKDSVVRCYSTKGDYKEYTVKRLCPFPFEEDDLK